MINENFRIVTNKDAKRYEFHSQSPVFNSYTVGFHEVNSLDDAYIAVYMALKKDMARLNEIASHIGKTGC